MPHNLTLCLDRYTLAGKMAIIERIEQVRQELAEKTAREEAEKVAAEKAKENAYTTRRDSIKKLANEVFMKSGILENFSQIRKNLLQKNFKNHQIFESESGATSHEPGYENQMIIMRWGDGELYHSDDYYYIDVEFDHKLEELIIKGANEKRLNKTEWNNKEIVEKTVAESFINPGCVKRVTYSDHESNPAAGIGA
jgi:hypothetical protein